MMRRLWVLTFLCLSFSFALAAQARAQGVGSTSLSAISLQGADGKSFNLGQLRGNVVLLSFGATWCEPCREELKALEQLKREYRDKPVKIVWVSIETEDQVSNGKLRDYVKKLKVTFPVLRDPDKSTFLKFSPRLRLPTIVFFDRNGNISTPNHVGMAEPSLYLSTMRGRLDKLLGVNSSTRSTGR